MHVHGPPLVSILMPVYNGGEFLREAIESILSQTFRDFEFLIINDGSNDCTAQIIADYAKRDARIRAFDQPNQGLIATLNRGIDLARGEYIARMDADDIAELRRLEMQLDYMRQNPKVGLLGTAVCFIDSAGRRLGNSHVLTDDLTIRWNCLLANAFSHPTIMMRRELLTKYQMSYARAFNAIEDYDLWTRMLRYVQAANLRQPLVRYRVHSGSITTQKREVMVKNQRSIALRTIKEQLGGFSVTPYQVSQLIWLTFSIGDPTPGLESRRSELAEMYLDMYAAYSQIHSHDHGLEAVRREVGFRTMRILFGLPLRSGWFHVIKRLVKMDPLLPGYVIAALPQAIAARMRNSAVDRLRAHEHR